MAQWRDSDDEFYNKFPDTISETKKLQSKTPNKLFTSEQ
jgi:hypothetical protein